MRQCKYKNYFDDKLKTDIDEYKSGRIMAAQNPSVEESQLKNLQSDGVPVKMSKVYVLLVLSSLRGQDPQNLESELLRYYRQKNQNAIIGFAASKQPKNPKFTLNLKNIV